MSFKDLDIKNSYISFGENNIAKSLIQPLLKKAVLYKRSVGFFSSSVISTIMPGIVEFARNGGKIQLITSPKLSSEDVETINAGYADREIIIKDAMTDDFVKGIQEFEIDELNLLYELITNGILDIKVVITNTIGMYHDKLGIIIDDEDNSVVFYGSPNATYSGYMNNYEKVRVVSSWKETNDEIIRDEINEFDSIWNGKNDYLKVYDFGEAAKSSVITVVNYKREHGEEAPVKLRDYQIDAKDAWINNNYKGFFVMATGTGKTWTALFSAKELIEKRNPIVVICAPYKHLIKQWADDVNSLFSDAKVIMVSSENVNWEKELNDEIIRIKYKDNRQLIIVSTIMSFMGERFSNTIKKTGKEKLLIVDEAHRFNNRDEKLHEEYKYLLGLSATPDNGKIIGAGKELTDFFGGTVFDLPIEKAIGKYLVNYSYHPIFLNSTYEEEERFKKISSKMAACYSNGKIIDYDSLMKYSRDRLRLISMAEEKTDRIEWILNRIKDRDHFIVYCGDGKVYDDQQEEIKHIQFVKNSLDRLHYKASQFTALESMDTRMKLVKAFNKGEIDSLAAIRCLDEGINIPSIRSALLLSSNDSYREFVQRRGRILRLYKNKDEANIYDVIVLPSTNTKGIAIIELRRYYEYAKLANNKTELINKLEELMSEYSLNYEDIQFNVNQGEEEMLDE